MNERIERSATAEIMRWLYQNPGVYTPGDVADKTGFARSTCSNVMATISGANPGMLQRINRSTYMVRPPELPQAELSAPALQPVQQPRREPEWEEIRPDDDEIYPPFKIRIYDHFRSKRGEQMFRVKDETGRRGIFFWVDDE